jgi:tetratricopeptide (TPR) repeat protein
LPSSFRYAAGLAFLSGHDMDRTITLFDVPQRRLREVQKALSVLDLEAAGRTMEVLAKQYPDHPEVRREHTIVRFLQETISTVKKPAQLFTQFSALKKLLREHSYIPEYMSDLERAYFGRVVDAAGDQPLGSIYGYPPGYLLLKAGRLEDARRSLTEELSGSGIPPKKRAHLLGYLGDVFIAGGEIEQARRYYVEAIQADTSGIDTKALLDDDTKALILGTYIPEGLGGIWAASVGYILMVFPPPAFRDSSELMAFFKEFNRLRPELGKDDSDETPGRVFYHALVMVEHEALFRALKGADMMELRKLMRTINPALFRFYTKASMARRGGEHLPESDS